MASRFVIPNADVGDGIKPEDGAKLSFFETGTSTPKNTFSDAAGTIPNANPVIADANGVFPDIFITGKYKVILTDKNDVQTGFGEADPVDEFAIVSDATFVKNIATLTAALADTGLVNVDAVNLKENVSGKGGGGIWDIVPSGTFPVSAIIFDVFDHDTLPIQLKLRNDKITTLRQLGAVGGGIGGADETAIIQALFTIGDKIFIEDGDYKYTSTINLTKRFHLDGDGVSATPTQGSILRFIPTVAGDFGFAFSSLDYWTMRNIYHLGPGRATGTSEVCLDMFNPTGNSEFAWRLTDCKFEDWNKAGVYLAAQWQGKFLNCTFQKCGDTTDIPGGSILPHTGGIAFEENGGTPGWSGSGDVIDSCHFISCSYGIYNDKGWNVITLNAIYEDCGFPFFKSPGGTMMLVLGDWQEDFGNPNFKQADIQGDVLQLGGRDSTGLNNPRYRQHGTAETEMQFNAYAGTQDCLAQVEATRHDISTKASKLRFGTTDTAGTLANHWEVTQDGDLDPVVDNARDIGSPLTQAVKNINAKGFMAIGDGITAPGANVGFAKLYVDSADGDLKIIFGDGTVKTIVVDT